jgi:HEAT repeat protein
MKARWLLSGMCSLAAGCADYAKPSVQLYERGDYVGASRAADQGLAAHPGDAMLWNAKIRAALAQGDGGVLAAAYASYAHHRKKLDKPLLRDMVVATLLQAIGSPSVKLKVAAIKAVEDIEIQSMADTVHDQFHTDDDRVVAAAAIAILHGGYGDELVAAGQMLHSEDAEARRIVVDGFGRKMGLQVSGDLEAAADDRDVRVRRAALHWLGEIKDVGAVEVLARHLHDRDAEARAASAGSLAKLGIGDLLALAKTALADKARVVRLAGVELVVASRLGAEQLVALAADDDPLVALAAATAVRATRPELAGQAAARALAAPEAATRVAALDKLVAAVGAEAARPLAHPLLADADATVRFAAARLLAHAGEPAAAVPVFAAAEDDPQAAAELAALGDPRGVDRLTAFVRDFKRSPDQRAAACQAHRIARVVSPGLVAALADPNAVVRVAAAASLGAIAK